MTVKKLTLSILVLGLAGILYLVVSQSHNLVSDNLSSDTTNRPLSPSESPSKPTSPNSVPTATPDQTSKPQLGTGGSVITTSDKEATETYIANHNLTIVKTVTLSNNQTLLTLAEKPDDPSVTALSQTVKSAKVSQNFIYKAAATPNDSKYSEQWGLAKIAAPEAWDISTGTSSTVIAILDTGILFSQTIPSGTFSHSDFPSSKQWTNTGESGSGKETNGVDDDGNGKIDDWQGWDFMGGFAGGSNCPNGTSGSYVLQDNDPGPYSCDTFVNPAQLNKTHYSGGCAYDQGACYLGHGTMVSSIAGAATNNGLLMAGVDHNARLMNLRVLDGYGATDTSIVTAAVNYATAKGANIINLSLTVSICTGGISDPVLESALAAAKAAGVLVVGAAGNEGAGTPGHVCYPGSSTNAIAVGATDINDSIAEFSNSGPELDVAAPGVNVPIDNAPSSYLNADYLSAGSGTSFAAPHVSGLAGLLKARLPSATPDDLARIIKAQTDKVAGMGGAEFTNFYGYGRINAGKALRFTASTHPDGTLVIQLGGTSVYLIEGSLKRYVPHPVAFFSNYGYIDSRVKQATSADLALGSGSNLDYAEGTLLKGSGPEVYAVERSGETLQKRHINSVAAYQSLGYGDNDKLVVSDALLPSSTGTQIGEGSPHPNGSLIRQPGGLAVYLIDNGQKRYVPNPGTLRSLHKGAFKVYGGTTADMALPDGTNVDFAEGALVRASDSPVVYVIDVASAQTTKRHISSAAIFQTLGYSASDIIDVPAGQLPSQTGSPIN